MALTAHLLLWGPNGQPLTSAIEVKSPDGSIVTASEIWAFVHQVWSNRAAKTFFNTWFDVRKHEPMVIAKPLDRLTPFLYKYCCDFTFLPKAEVRWYWFNKKLRKEEEYFRFTLEQVSVSSVKTIMPDVKDPHYARYAPYEEIALCYTKITWLFYIGYRIHSDKWDGFFSEGALADMEMLAPVDGIVDEPIGPLTVSFRKVALDESKEPVEPARPFTVTIDVILSRNLLDRKEGLVNLSLWSSYMGKKSDMNYIADAYLDEKGCATAYFSSLPANKEWKEDAGKPPGAAVEYWCTAGSKYASGVFDGEHALVPKAKKLPKVSSFIDCHMHVFSPKAAPLPTIWVQKTGAKLLVADWEKIEKEPRKTFLKWLTHDYPEYAGMTTEALGERAMSDSEKVLKDGSLTKLMGKPEERERILVALGIDIEMGHYWGYEGKGVYEKNEQNEIGYYKYENGKRDWSSLSETEAKKLFSFKKQLQSAQNVFSKNKGRSLVFFPFDPRRWQGKKISGWGGKPTDPFAYLIQSSSDPDKLKTISTSIGFKLYTALGFRPDDYKPRMVTSRDTIPQKKILDEKLPDLKSFYASCASKGIPIVCHCSRGGIFAHDFELYYDYLFGGDDASEKEKKEYFYDVYVSPFAWEQVLKDFPSLRLCLAHFGGEEEWETDEGTPMPWAEKCAELANDSKHPHFYIDLAYFTFKEPSARQKLKKMLEKYPKLKEKILFGTDWYLIGGEKAKFGKYENYFKVSIEALAEIDPELPAYAMVINPKRFLDLENIAEKIAEVWGPEYSGLVQLVKEKMPGTIEKFYV